MNEDKLDENEISETAGETDGRSTKMKPIVIAAAAVVVI